MTDRDPPEWLLDKLSKVSVAEGSTSLLSDIGSASIADDMTYLMQGNGIELCDSIDRYTIPIPISYNNGCELWRFPTNCDKLETVHLDIVIPGGFSELTMAQRTRLFNIEFKIDYGYLNHRIAFCSALLRTISQDIDLLDPYERQFVTTDAEMRDHLHILLLDCKTRPIRLQDLYIERSYLPKAEPTPYQFNVYGTYLKAPVESIYNDVPRNMANTCTYENYDDMRDAYISIQTDTMCLIYYVDEGSDKDQTSDLFIGFRLTVDEYTYQVEPLTFSIAGIVFYIIPLSTEFQTWSGIRNYLSVMETYEYHCSLREWIDVSPIMSLMQDQDETNSDDTYVCCHSIGR